MMNLTRVAPGFPNSCVQLPPALRGLALMQVQRVSSVAAGPEGGGNPQAIGDHVW